MFFISIEVLWDGARLGFGKKHKDRRMVVLIIFKIKYSLFLMVNCAILSSFVLSFSSFSLAFWCKRVRQRLIFGRSFSFLSGQGR